MTKKFKFKKIDAFATNKSDGNPAAYIRLKSKSDITEDEMQKIAKELKGFVNEVGYVYQTSAEGFNLKYYSSEREVDFCGHATIAIMYDLIKNEPDLQQFDSLKIRTNKGELKVDNRISKENAVFIMSPIPEEKEKLLELNYIADKLKINPEYIDINYPTSIINAGLTTLLVPIKNLNMILNINPDIDKLKTFCLDSKVDIIEVFTNEVSDKSNDYRTRVFAPIFGYLEDPATGSGNSAFGYYLLKNKLFNKETIVIEQNGLKDRYNIIKLQKEHDENRNERILFGGGAIIRLAGEYFLQ